MKQRQYPAFVMVLLAAAWLALAGRVWAGPRESVVLVEDGLVRAAIVTADEPSRIVEEVAKDMQEVIAEMSGAQLEIVKESDFAGDTTAILVGPSRLARRKGVRVKQDYEDYDHYVVRTGRRFVAVVGNDDRRLQGTAYAVYDLLQRLGCGWYGPNPVWHVIPKTKTITVPALDVDERPDFLMRIMWGAKGRQSFYALRAGGYDLPSQHNLEELIPREKYPQYYKSESHQPCMTEPEVIEMIVKQFREELDKRKGVQSFSLTANDTPNFCRCENCRAVGNVSALSLNFANRVARELAKTHPKRYRLTFLAYWVTHSPPRPMIKVEPGVHIMMVNEGNHLEPWENMPEHPEVAKRGRNNTREVRDFAGWQRTGGLIAIYEWWIPGCNNHMWRIGPWYAGDVALENFRYWYRSGIRHVIFEAHYNRADEYPQDFPGYPQRWPLYYVGLRGMWDMEVSSEQVMTEACDKLFGPASPHMFKFYRLLEAAAVGRGGPPEFLAGGNWSIPSPQRLYTPEIRALAAKHLADAAQATEDPKQLARIADERRMWNRICGIMAEREAAAAKAKAEAEAEAKAKAEVEAEVEDEGVQDE